MKDALKGVLLNYFNMWVFFNCKIVDITIDSWASLNVVVCQGKVPYSMI